MDPPALLTDDAGVRLRPLREDDAPAFAAAFADDPQLGVLVGVEEDPDEAAVRERVARNETRDGFELALTADGSDVLRGVVIVHHVEERHGRAEVGFWLVRDARRAGLGRRAVALVVDWLFAHPWVRRVEISTTPENAGAMALAERLGFTYEGTLRQRDVERGTPVDIVWFGLLRDEWPPAGL
jgi:[ribosomal protein S5]-alanine N-acetyltransferase